MKLIKNDKTKQTYLKVKLKCKIQKWILNINKN